MTRPPEIVSSMANSSATRIGLLIGIDAPSVDPTGDETLAAHHVLADAGAIICENLRNLEAVDFPDPLVSLLPIPFAGIDGAPVRAVAVQIEN